MRRELLREVDIARAELETSLNDLRGTSSNVEGSIIEQSQARLSSLNSARDQLVGGANGRPLASIRAEVSAAFAAIQAYASDARAAAAVGQSTQATARAELEHTNSEARRITSEIANDLFERRIFDPYLRFASAADQAAYREREAEREKRIEKALAEQSPSSTLKANRLAIDQLKDAGVHGADRSPEYGKMLERLEETNARLAPLVEKKAESQVDPQLVAQLRAAGVKMPDQQQDGHGLSIKVTAITPPGRQA